VNDAVTSNRGYDETARFLRRILSREFGRLISAPGNERAKIRTQHRAERRLAAMGERGAADLESVVPVRVACLIASSLTKPGRHGC
jgi:hypothetical protein